MNDKVRPINKSIEKWEIKKKKGTLAEAVADSTIDFKDANQGIEVLAFAASIRALGLSNRDLQPRKLSNYIRSGYLQIQIICSIILFQFRGDRGASRDDLYEQYLKDTLKTEPVEAALRRSIASMMDWAQEQNVQWSDYFRLVNTSRAVQHIQTGHLSPWLILGCEAGKKMLQSF